MKNTLAVAALGLLLVGCGTQPRVPAAPRTGMPALAGRTDPALARMTAACAQGMRQIFDGIDADGDAVVTRAEWDGRCLSAEWWADRDEDGDGRLRPDDFSTPAENAALARKVLQECDDELAEFDRNGDGEVSGPELEGDGAVMRSFDDDQDGRVTLREIQRFWERFMGGEIGTIIWPECPAPAHGRPARTVVAPFPGGMRSRTWVVGQSAIGPPHLRR